MQYIQCILADLDKLPNDMWLTAHVMMTSRNPKTQNDVVQRKHTVAW